MPAAKNEHADAVAEHVDTAEQVADQQDLVGIQKVTHNLDVAFIHALAGAEDKAKASLKTAEAEIDRYAPTLSHLRREVSLMVAKVHAVLAHGK